MTKSKLFISTVSVIAITFTGITGCTALHSVISNAGKAARNMTKFGSQSQTSDVVVNEELIIPPGLKVPASKPAPGTSTKPAYESNKNYYIVVGTYPDQAQALDTFVRLSSIGLPGATMESRKTKVGKSLHMVRLGPYHKQEEIDKVKDTLASDGLSQFKLVED